MRKSVKDAIAEVSMKLEEAAKLVREAKDLSIEFGLYFDASIVTDELTEEERSSSWNSSVC